MALMIIHCKIYLCFLFSWFAQTTKILLQQIYGIFVKHEYHHHVLIEQ